VWRGRLPLLDSRTLKCGAGRLAVRPSRPTPGCTAASGDAGSSVTLQPGTRVPAYCTANGRMLHAGRMSVEQMVERCLPTLIKYQVELNALL